MISKKELLLYQGAPKTMLYETRTDFAPEGPDFFFSKNRTNFVPEVLENNDFLKNN